MSLTKAEFLIEKAKEIQRDIDVRKKQTEAAFYLTDRIYNLRAYDETVQKMISVHPDLAEEWKEFERVFLLHTGEEVFRTAEEKINNARNKKCTGCGKYKGI